MINFKSDWHIRLGRCPTPEDFAVGPGTSKANMLQCWSMRRSFISAWNWRLSELASVDEDDCLRTRATLFIVDCASTPIRSAQVGVAADDVVVFSQLQIPRMHICVRARAGDC